MQIVFSEDNLHEMSNLDVWGKIRKYISMSFAEILLSMLNVNAPLLSKNVLNALLIICLSDTGVVDILFMQCTLRKKRYSFSD